MQKEMIWYIWEKWDINVHRFTISRILKRRRWSNKKEQRVEVRQNDELRLNWVADMLRLTVEQLVFVNESLFNEITGWCHQVYAFVDQSARYQVSRTKEHCWSVLSIYTKDEYLFCTDIREGWFNDEACKEVEGNRDSSTFNEMRASLRQRSRGTARSRGAARSVVFDGCSAWVVGFLRLSDALEGMRESSRDRLWLRRWGISNKNGYKNVNKQRGLNSFNFPQFEGGWDWISEFPIQKEPWGSAKMNAKDCRAFCTR